MLFRSEVLFSVAQKFYAGQALNFEELTLASKPSLTDLRLIVLSLKKALVKPRSNGRYHVIGSPEFFFDMISDPIVEKYMTINQTTKTMYDDTQLVPLFGMEFYETLVVPTTGDFLKVNGSVTEVHKRMVKGTTDGETGVTTYAYASAPASDYASTASGYVQDSRTGQNASYIPDQLIWDMATADQTDLSDYSEFKAQHVLVVGKDALTRTGLTGEGNVKMYVKAKGSAGVLDQIGRASCRERV